MNKFSAILGDEVQNIKKTTCTNAVINLQDRELLEHICGKVSGYLSMDVYDLLADTDAAIFGGAIRDSIADLEIHDVDILALPRAAATISTKLQAENFKLLHLSSTDLVSMYKDIKLINEPWTFIKNDAIVQVIRPAVRLGENSDELFKKLLANVDISACGVHINYYGGVWETCNSAIEHCKKRSFVVLKDNLMHQKDRIDHRVTKLLDRGWTQIESVPVLINVDENGVDVSIAGQDSRLLVDDQESPWMADNPNSPTTVRVPSTIAEAMDVVRQYMSRDPL